jgi:hypothetical protein
MAMHDRGRPPMKHDNDGAVAPRRGDWVVWCVREGSPTEPNGICCIARVCGSGNLQLLDSGLDLTRSPGEMMAMAVAEARQRGFQAWYLAPGGHVRPAASPEAVDVLAPEATRASA